jgi:hypothetical protein
MEGNFENAILLGHSGAVKRRELPAHNKAAGMTIIPSGFLCPPVPHKHLSGAFQAIVA